MARIVIRWIDWYQKRGGGKDIFGIDCIYDPTCSQYAKEAIIKHGLFIGSLKSIRRVISYRDYNTR